MRGLRDRDRCRFERALHRRGYQRIAGVDEAGMGALAGPLVAAAVILPEGFDLRDIRDSKGLTPRQREEPFERIVSRAEYSVCWADPYAIDQLRMRACHLELLSRVVRELDPEPDYVLIDGVVQVPGVKVASRLIKRGDDRSASIAAASIVAKVTRDRMMDALDREHPGFGFGQNRGYGPDQWKYLEDRAPIPGVHRFSFKGVAQLAFLRRPPMPPS